MAITTQILDSVLFARIEREEVLNALDKQHLQSLIDVFDTARNDKAIGCLVITGKGRAFSVGADIKAMDTMTDEQFTQAANLYQDMCKQARSLDKPIVAAINGYALGGGLEVALMADIRIAGRSAKLGLPDAELGFSPTGGLTYLLNHMVGASWALHMAMTAEILDAEKAMDIGLVTQLSEDESLESDAMSLATRLAAYPVTGMKNIKRSFNAALENSLESILELEAKFDSECYQSKETRQALRDFIATRKK